MDATDKSREDRLRRAASRQRLVLRKSRARDPLAVGCGLFCVADFSNCLVAGGALSGYSMSLDEVEIYLADAQDFDVYFTDPLGDYRRSEQHYLEWRESYWFGNGWREGWLLTERSDDPNDHFILMGRTQLWQAAREARDTVAYWGRSAHAVDA